MFTIGRLIGSVASGLFSLLVLFGIEWMVMESYWYSHILGWIVGIIVNLFVIVFLDSAFSKNAPHYYIFLMTYWDYFDPKNPKIKLWGRRAVAILLGYNGKLINVNPREWTFMPKAYTKGDIQVDAKFRIGWQPVFRASSDPKKPGEEKRIVAYYEYIADAKRLFPDDQDSEARKMEQFLGGIIADAYQNAIAEFEKFEEIRTKENKIAITEAVKKAIETQLNIKDLGIEIIRINLEDQTPPAGYLQTMEQRQTERLQRDYETYEKDTETAQVTKMVSGTGLTGAQAYDRLMLLKARDPNAYAKVVEAEAKRHIADAVRDGMGALGKALGEALKGGK